jgi:hypothetical protein
MGHAFKEGEENEMVMKEEKVKTKAQRKHRGGREGEEV